MDGIEKKRAELDEANFILAIESPAAPTKAIAEKDAGLQDEQRKAAQPKAHAFALEPE